MTGIGEGSLARIYAALVGLVLGVCAASVVAVLPVVVAGCAATACLCLRRRPAVSFVGLVAAAASWGVLVAGPQHDPTALENLAPHIPQCEVTGRLLEHAGGLGSLVAADVVVCEAFRPLNKAGILVVERPDAEVGAVIRLRGWLLPLSASESFDVARRRLGAQASMSSSEAEVVASPTGLHAVAARIRGGLEDAVMGMQSDSAALLSGLTTGETHGMSAHTEELVRRAGLSHLVAVSGYMGAYTDGFRDTPVLGVQVGIPGENRTKRVHFCAYVDVNLRPHLEGLSSSPGATSSAMGGPIGTAIGSAMDTGH